jgi:hypothetical protein
MTTKEKINENPFDSDYEEELLFDELISTSNSSKYTCISRINIFTYVHEKAYCDNVYRIKANLSCNDNKKRFNQNLIVKNEVEGGKPHVC